MLVRIQLHLLSVTLTHPSTLQSAVTLTANIDMQPLLCPIRLNIYTSHMLYSLFSRRMVVMLIHLFVFHDVVFLEGPALNPTDQGIIIPGMLQLPLPCTAQFTTGLHSLPVLSLYDEPRLSQVY